ncbi:MAG: hypothetical protein WCJ56_04630 [bacterium]
MKGKNMITNNGAQFIPVCLRWIRLCVLLIMGGACAVFSWAQTAVVAPKPSTPVKPLVVTYGDFMTGFNNMQGMFLTLMSKANPEYAAWDGLGLGIGAHGDTISIWEAGLSGWIDGTATLENAKNTPPGSQRTAAAVQGRKAALVFVQLSLGYVNDNNPMTRALARSKTEQAIACYAAASKRAGAKLVFCVLPGSQHINSKLPWHKTEPVLKVAGDYVAELAVLNSECLRLQKAYDAVLAPIPQSYAMLRNLHPELDLHPPISAIDGHPSPRDSYLFACACTFILANARPAAVPPADVFRDTNKQMEGLIREGKRSAGFVTNMSDEEQKAINDSVWAAVEQYRRGAIINGTPQDDPTVVTKIRTMTQPAELLPYLDDASAQYRYEAALLLAKIAPKSAEAKWKNLLLNDSCAEIRAIAVQSLDAIDPAGKPGSAMLQGEIVKGNNGIVVSTLSQLDPATTEAVLVPLLGKDRDEKTRQNAINTVLDIGSGLCSPQLRQVVLDTAKSDPAPKVANVAVGVILCWWPSDPQWVTTLRNLPPWKIKDNSLQTMCITYIKNNLSPTERNSFLMDALAAGVRGDVTRWAVETKPAIPGLAEWIITAAKKGDNDAIRYLTAVTDNKAAADILVPLLEQPSAICAAATMLRDLKGNELTAATALARFVPTIIDNSWMVQQVMSVMDKYIAHPDIAVRTALIPGFIAVLNNVKALPSARRMAAERLARLGVDAKPALDALKQAATSTTKEVADAAAAAIKAIEASDTKTGK